MLFGFSETSYAETKQWLRLEPNRSGGQILESLANGEKFHVGTFDTPTLATLRQRGSGIKLPGKLTLRNEVGDVADLHGQTHNRFATFQVASQFNCLEFVGPSVVPEDGITMYMNDRTQGPACSIACGPATAYRNYFVPVPPPRDRPALGTQEGQTRDRMLDNLADLSDVVGNSPHGRLFRVQGGYTMADDAQLLELNAHLAELETAGGLDSVRAALRVGLHDDVEVSATNWGMKLLGSKEHLVSQVFGSACAVAYNRSSDPKNWDKLALLVLEASYEATLYAALLSAQRHRGAKGSKKVFLTCLGGGVFGNPMESIVGAVRRACDLFSGYDLDIRIVTASGAVHPALLQLERDVRDASVPATH